MTSGPNIAWSNLLVFLIFPFLFFLIFHFISLSSVETRTSSELYFKNPPLLPIYGALPLRSVCFQRFLTFLIRIVQMSLAEMFLPFHP